MDTVQNSTLKSQLIYSIPIGEERQVETKVHRHPQCQNGLLQIPNDIKNLSDFWQKILEKYPNNKAIQDITYQELNNLSKIIGSWFFGHHHLKIYMYAKTCVEWTIIDIACWNYSIINIPLYDTLGPQSFHHIIKLTQGTAVCLTNDLTNNLQKILLQNKQKINTVIYLDDPSQQNIKVWENIGVNAITFKSLLIDQQIFKKPIMNLDSHLTYIFTSGTTGLAKGVITTHKAVIAQCLAMKGLFQYKQDDIHFSYFPIAHIYQRFLIWLALFYGSNIKYNKRPISQITKQFKRIKPTILAMVPRLLNKFYPTCKEMFDKQNNSDGVKLFFGGKVRKIIAGSAPISPQILSFFSKTLQCDIRQGYGQTETVAPAFLIYQGDTNFGYVGGPNRATEFKLIDVPEMGYFTSSNFPKGQICNRGLVVFNQYYKDEKNTKETIDQQGWNHTGDIGMILPNGALKIIDRKKNIFKLSQGQFVAPQKIQNIYLRCQYVEQCFIYGQSIKDYIIAIIYPRFQKLKTLGRQLGIQYDNNNETLIQNKKVTQFILNQTKKHGKKQGLYGFQIAKKVKLSPVSFHSLGLYTTTLKLQRHIAKKIFQEEIKKMYNEQI